MLTENNKTGKTAHPEERGLWTPGRALAFILMAALVIRVLATLTRQMVQFDETAYLRMAENLAAGNGLLDVSGLNSTHFAPLLPAFIAGMAFVVRDYVLAGYIVAIVFGVLLLIPVYLLGKELLGARAGLMAAALMAAAPIFVGTSEFIYSEGIYIFFLLMALFYGWHMLKRPRLQCGLLAGVSLGLAYLANPSAVFYLAVLLLLAAGVAWRRGAWRRMARPAALLVACFSLFAVPYIIFIHSELGRWTFSGKSTAGNIYSATHNIRRDDIKGWEKELLALTGDHGEPLVLSLERRGDNPVNFILGSPVPAVKNFLKESFRFHGGVLSQVLPLWLLPLLGLGLFARGWSRERAAAIGYLLLMMAPAALVLAMYAHARFFMPFVPFAMMLVAAGWERLEGWGAETVAYSCRASWQPRCSRWAPWVIGAAVLLPLLALSAVMVQRTPYETQYKEAGEWLKDRAGGGARVMNREYSSAYYAGGVAVILPYAGYREMTDYARSRDVDYLIVGRTAIQDFRPGQEELLKGGAAHPEWRLLHVVRPGTSQETLIFELER